LNNLQQPQTTTTTTMIYSIPMVETTTILKRPSAYCKTPYVADICIDNTPHMAHTPALGCCGLSDKDRTVIVSKLDQPKAKSKTKCTYRVELALIEERGRRIIVGINPKLAETIVDKTLCANQFSFLQNYKKVEREKTYMNSRFDFAGVDANDTPFIMEVKNVPLADYVDVPKTERAKYKGIERRRCYNEKIAYFPDGYRKNSTDVVSPRALKHIQELETIKTTTNHRCILCFVVQRTDVMHFQPSNIDLTYKECVRKAWRNGVEIYALQYEWTEDGICRFVQDQLPVMLFDTYGCHKINDDESSM